MVRKIFSPQPATARTGSRSPVGEALICLCLIVVTLSAYGQVRHHDFIDFDDDIYVTSNRYVQNGLTVDGLKWALGTHNEHRTYWHPLTWLSHMLDVQMFGVKAGSSLMVNVLLHILNSVLLYIVLRRWSDSWWPAAIAATLFALHPICVESVAWVASRKTLLSCFFWFLTLQMYGHYADRPGPVRYLIVFICYLLGLMAKPVLVTLPFVLLLMDYWPLGRLTGVKPHCGSRVPVAHLVVEKIPLFALSLLSIGLSMTSLQGHGSIMPYGAVPIGLRIGNALVSYVGYIGKFFWPSNLSVFYPFPQDIPSWQPIGASLLLSGVTLVTWWLRRRKPYLIVGWLWFIGTLIPVIGLVQAGYWPAMADRFAYIPFTGLYVMIAWGCSGGVLTGRHYRIVWVLTAVFAMLLAVRTWDQTTYWKNSPTLFGHAIALDENNIIARNNIGKSLIKSGQIEEAIRHYRIALQANPNYISARKNLGAALALQGKIDESIAQLVEALRLDPTVADAHYNLGNIFAGLGRSEEAIQHYGKALELDPEYVEAYNNLANLLAALGRIDDAVKCFKKSLSLNPRFAAAHNNLGAALIRNNQLQEAIAHFRNAIDIRPGYAEAHNNLGIALKKQGRDEQAIIHYQRALQLKPEYSEAHFNLGLALVKLKKIETAVGHFEAALRIKPDDLQTIRQLEKSQAAVIAVNLEIEKIKASIDLNPSNPELYVALGDLSRKKGTCKAPWPATAGPLSLTRPSFRPFSEWGPYMPLGVIFTRRCSRLKRRRGLIPRVLRPAIGLPGCMRSKKKPTKLFVGWRKPSPKDTVIGRGSKKILNSIIYALYPPIEK